MKPILSRVVVIVNTEGQASNGSQRHLLHMKSKTVSD